MTLSRIKTSSCVIEPITYERLANIKSSKTLKHRLNEEETRPNGTRNLQQISLSNVLQLFRLAGMYETPQINEL